jgi:hypothetical protein
VAELRLLGGLQFVAPELTYRFPVTPDGYWRTSHWRR